MSKTFQQITFVFFSCCIATIVMSRLTKSGFTQVVPFAFLYLFLIYKVDEVAKCLTLVRLMVFEFVLFLTFQSFSILGIYLFRGGQNLRMGTDMVLFNLLLAVGLTVIQLPFAWREYKKLKSC